MPPKVNTLFSYFKKQPKKEEPVYSSKDTAGVLEPKKPKNSADQEKTSPQKPGKKCSEN